MSVRWSFEKCKTFTDLYMGFTQEDIDYWNYQGMSDKTIDVDAWCEAPHSPWFKPEEAEHEDLKAIGAEKGWVIMGQKSYVSNILTVLMAVMPAPGWGLTDKNMDEAVRRILVYQEICGPLGSEFQGPSSVAGDKRSFWKEKYVTEEEIRLLSGLSVNFSTVTKPEYAKRVEQWVWEQVNTRVRKAKSEAEKETTPA